MWISPLADRLQPSPDAYNRSVFPSHLTPTGVVAKVSVSFFLDSWEMQPVERAPQEKCSRLPQPRHGRLTNVPKRSRFCVH